MNTDSDRMTRNKVFYGYLIKHSITWIVSMFLFIAILLFGISGNMDWYNGWILLYVFIITSCVNFTILLILNPEVIEERIQFHRGSKRWDVYLMSFALIFILGTFVIGALDERYNWSSTKSDIWFYTGIISFILGDILILWAMVVNKWFSKLVRIQTERDHRVVSRGPYSIIRHPGYLSWAIMWMGVPLILDSVCALIPALCSCVLMVIRASLEDKTLQNELPGYLEYTKKVRYKLIPGLW